jgi:hypothetical protein
MNKYVKFTQSIDYVWCPNHISDMEKIMMPILEGTAVIEINVHNF